MTQSEVQLIYHGDFGDGDELSAALDRYVDFYNHRARAKRFMSRGKARCGDPEEVARPGRPAEVDSASPFNSEEVR